MHATVANASPKTPGRQRLSREAATPAKIQRQGTTMVVAAQYRDPRMVSSLHPDGGLSLVRRSVAPARKNSDGFLARPLVHYIER